jgi:hypothetical protein
MMRAVIDAALLMRRRNLIAYVKAFNRSDRLPLDPATPLEGFSLPPDCYREAVRPKNAVTGANYSQSDT